MPSKIHIPKEEIERLYIEEDMDQKEVAEKLNCSVDTIRSRRREYGIETKKVDAENGRKSYDNRKHWNREVLEDLYINQRLSAYEIADKLDCGITTVYRWMDKFDIKRRNASQAKTIQRTNYRVNQKGYPLHISANAGGEKKNIVFTHQLLACIDNDPSVVFDSNTVVHHNNHIPFDNRRENLTVMTRDEHSRYHNQVVE